MKQIQNKPCINPVIIRSGFIEDLMNICSYVYQIRKPDDSRERLQNITDK